MICATLLTFRPDYYASILNVDKCCVLLASEHGREKKASSGERESSSVNRTTDALPFDLSTFLVQSNSPTVDMNEYDEK